MVEYAPDGSGRTTKFKGYVYPNLQHRKSSIDIGDVYTTKDQPDASSMGGKLYSKEKGDYV